MDAGSGTGILSLFVAQRHPDCFFEAVEMQDSAFAFLKENVEASPFARQIECRLQNIFDYETLEKFDGIISNPPFFVDSLPPEDEGMKLAMHTTHGFAAKWIEKLASLLKEEGKLWLLWPSDNLEFIAKVLVANGLQILAIHHLAHSPTHAPYRTALCARKGEGAAPAKVTNSQVKGQRYEWDSNFEALLKDYYIVF